VYPRDAILILLYDDLQENPMAFIQQVFYFLKVDASFQPPSLYRKINPMNLVVTKSNFLRKTSQRLDNHRWLTRFSRLFDQLNRISIQPSEFPQHQKITSEVRQHLSDMYRQHNEQLGDFLGRDLSCWNSERD
jgi:hypothetical protein